MAKRKAKAVVDRPDWERLWGLVEQQQGLFTTAQATQSGFSSPLVVHHLRAGAIQRVRRGVYRLTRFPRGENEQLVALWLGLAGEGVFSHETALVLHELSDALPDKAVMTLPATWETRRVRYPEELVVHFADVPASERTWIGSVPVTGVQRTLSDCIQAATSPEQVEQAIDQAQERGLIRGAEAKTLRRRLDAALRKGAPR